MLSEIGSDFWENQLNTMEEAFLIEGIQSVDFGDYFISGRSAIRALCRQFNHNNKKVLLPAYTCETVVQPFEKEGWNIAYYEIRKNLSIDKKDLVEKINSFCPSLVLIQNYFGFNTTGEITQILDICQEESIVVVEDITQNILSKYEKIRADYYVGSLRKFFAIPEGGILLSKGSKAPCYLKKEAVSKILKEAQRAFGLKQKYINNEGICKEDFLEAYHIWKSNFIKYDEPQDINIETLQMLNVIDLKLLKTQRQVNYSLLCQELRNVTGVKIIVDSQDEEEVPLYFPMYIEDKSKRKELQQYLAKEKIYCPIIWPQYVSDEYLGEGSKYIYEHILCIPCDQRYGQEEMERIIDAIKTYARKIGD